MLLNLLSVTIEEILVLHRPEFKMEQKVPKKIIFGNDSQITKENQDLIKSIMKGFWKNILTLEIEKPIKISSARLNEIKRMNNEDIIRKKEFEIYKLNSSWLMGILGRFEMINDYNHRNINNKKILMKRSIADYQHTNDYDIQKSYNYLIKLKQFQEK